ncbi:MAG: hypothetical protein EXR72_07555 [Myxococcales bacterium]|nr:hypothetical protein [Myxococcales bacterium]
MTLRDRDGELVQLLRAAQLLLVKYPVAARATVRSFVAEGRRFAETEEGRAWSETLADSELLRRGRLVWEGCSLNMLEEDDRTVFPSVLLEALVAAAAHANLETLLARLFGAHDGAAVP